MAWDVDDVLNSLTTEWARAEGLPWSNAFGASPAEMAASVGVSGSDYLASLDGFRAVRYRLLAPDVQVRRWFDERGHTARHVAVTRTPLAAAGVVASWVLAHFGQWIQGFFVTPSPRSDDPPGVLRQSKAQVIARMPETVALVDDTAANLEALPASCRGLLYPQRWNGGGSKAEALSRLSRVIDRAAV